MAVQRTPRIYDFSVFATTMLPRLFDLDREAMKLASTNVDHPRGSWNFIVETSRIFHRCLSPGPSLDKMERAALTAILGYLDELEPKSNGAVLNLFAWLRTMMTVSSTEAVSVLNPFLPIRFADRTRSYMGHRTPSTTVLSWSRHCGKITCAILILETTFTKPQLAGTGNEILPDYSSPLHRRYWPAKATALVLD